MYSLMEAIVKTSLKKYYYPLHFPCNMCTQLVMQSGLLWLITKEIGDEDDIDTEPSYMY